MCSAFPYIFRGALDVRARAINMEMKIAAARALAELAREDVPDEVAAAYGARPNYGPDYIIPVPFDPRLISSMPPAVAQAAMDSKVARRPIVDMDAYREQLRTRLDPIAGVLQRVFQNVRRQAAAASCSPRARRSRSSAPRLLCAARARLGAARRPRGRVSETAQAAGIELGDGIEMINARLVIAQRRLCRLPL